MSEAQSTIVPDTKTAGYAFGSRPYEPKPLRVGLGGVSLLEMIRDGALAPADVCLQI